MAAPAPFPRRRSNRWYLETWPYRVFMLRELSAIFLAVYTVLLLVLVTRLHEGPGPFADYLDMLESAPLIAVHVVVLAFALLHTVTWFAAVPKGLPLRRGEEPVPPRLVIAANYVLLIAVTLVVVAIARG
jgi:fumarate reductase subunit C